MAPTKPSTSQRQLSRAVIGAVAAAVLAVVGAGAWWHSSSSSSSSSLAAAAAMRDDANAKLEKKQRQRTAAVTLRATELNAMLGAVPAEYVATVLASKLHPLPDSPRVTARGGMEKYCRAETAGGEDAEPTAAGDDDGTASPAKGYARVRLQPRCGRFVMDDFLSPDEADALKDFAAFGMAIGGGGSGGVTLVDFVAGVVSTGTRFANLSMLAARHQAIVARSKAAGSDADAGRHPHHHQAAVDLADALPRQGLLLWIRTIHRLRKLVEVAYGVAASKCKRLRLALPAFFSRIDNRTSKTKNDEYTHAHVDTEQYWSFDVTTLLYLSDEVEHLQQQQAAKPRSVDGGGDAAVREGLHHDTTSLFDAYVSDAAAAGVADGEDAEDARAEAASRRHDSSFLGGQFEFLNEREAFGGAGETASGSATAAATSTTTQNEKSQLCALHNDTSLVTVVTSSSVAATTAMESTTATATTATTSRTAPAADVGHCDKLVVHPRKGRVIMFTSGLEHPHRVDKERAGVRWTATNAFTCDQAANGVDAAGADGAFPPAWLIDLLVTEGR